MLKITVYWIHILFTYNRVSVHAHRPASGGATCIQWVSIFDEKLYFVASEKFFLKILLRHWFLLYVFSRLLLTFVKAERK